MEFEGGRVYVKESVGGKYGVKEKVSVGREGERGVMIGGVGGCGV